MNRAIFELKAELRQDKLGKGASRLLRRANLVPAIMYGGGEKPTNIKLVHHDVLKAIENEAFFSRILTVELNDKKYKAILRDLQRHPFKKIVLHMDFQRVSDDEVISMKIPLHFLNGELCEGVKNGGVISHNISEINIRCQAKNLPQFVAVDLKNLALDQTIHLSELQLPEGVEIPEISLGAQHDLPVVSVHIPKIVVEDETKAADATAAAATATPDANAAAPAAAAAPKAKGGDDKKKDK